MSWDFFKNRKEASKAAAETAKNNARSEHIVKEENKDDGRNNVPSGNTGNPSEGTQGTQSSKTQKTQGSNEPNNNNGKPQETKEKEGTTGTQS